MASSGPRKKNLMLAALPSETRARVLRQVDTVTLKRGQVLQELGAAIEHVYFPVDTIVSLFATTKSGKGLEVGLVGPEGMVGVSLALGAATSAVRAVAQADGSAMCMSASAFGAELKHDSRLRDAVARYAYVKMATAMQIAACSQSHLLQSRFARWLLIARDGLATNSFTATQESVAQMLGVRRTAIGEAARRLQQQGLIRVSRGTLTVTDAGRLRAAACACYEAIRAVRAKTVPSARRSAS